MVYKFTLVLNAGRSGSTFLYKLLKQNFGNSCYVSHEDIPVQISKPRVNNRKYKQQEIDELKNNDELMSYIFKWQSELKEKPVIETGWTAYHLAPLLKDIFQDKFQIVILHRDPISFAFSRANMGNYYDNTFYTDHHEVSPFDTNSIVPSYKEKWVGMNHFEKCMFWWYTVYSEAFEFKNKFPEVPCLILKSKSLFNFSMFEPLLDFLELDYDSVKVRDVTKNELAQFMRETFPVKNEWDSYEKHPEILNFASELGYSFEHENILMLSEKYKLPKGFFSMLRNKTNYWKIKSHLRQFLKI